MNNRYVDTAIQKTTAPGCLSFEEAFAQVQYFRHVYLLLVITPPSNNSHPLIILVYKIVPQDINLWYFRAHTNFVLDQVLRRGFLLLHGGPF